MLAGGYFVAPNLADFVARGKRLTSAHADDRGVITDDPAALAAAASAVVGRTVSPEAYALARMLRSEAGTRAPAEKVAVAWVARNDADDLGWSLLKVLTYHKGTGRESHFGPQITGRYATTQDPYENDLKLAEAVLSGQFPDPTGGATKFVHKSSFGVQAGTGSYAQIVDSWAQDGLIPASVDGAASDFVVFRRGFA